MLSESIYKKLNSYDGKRVAPFQEIAEELAIQPDALEVTLSIIESNEEHAHVGGTWILKNLLELGLESDGSLCKKVLRWLRESTEIDARLHLLQILNLIEIPSSCHPPLYAKARELTSDRNTFVRAWAYNALGLIAQRNPQFLAETKQRFEQAQQKEAPSIRARIRNIKLP